MSNEKPRYNEIIFSNEEVKKIIELYKSNISTVKIGKEFNVSHKTIAKVLEKNGIPRTGVSRRKYNVNENYFDNIDTVNKAYILGFLYADGYNSLSKSTVSISLQEEDKYILEFMKKEMESEKPLEFIDYAAKTDFGYHYKNQYRLLIFNKHMCDRLNALGMTQNKSLTLNFPSIDKSFYSHFIRGYFDGDGSVCFCSTNSNCIATITSTEIFCNEIKRILECELGIHVGIYDASNKNNITKVASISGKNQVEKFGQYIYHDAESFLYRKYNKFVEKYTA